MEEEFQESEVIFPENIPNREEYSHDAMEFNSPGHLNSRDSRKPKPKRRRQKNSIPINIPEHVSGNSWFPCVDSDFFDHEERGEIVPPHVIVGQRTFDGKVAFSVCSGNGRTLKGRNLSQVRNSILRMTGFLEA
ncbi:Collagen alpha-1(XIX) chain like [Actinidia chinensis var. chinensis]|uniref:Collagen alpha-1(XIX) chain like n=1 Tax=Actinidia chinensis var. chinensis TaxID=1590841 RepID=A0A2R6Q6S2_ACTCC|nr:Collagen alpha-1(XIX) chain like [Actinidia chinensis var. chinensis]